MKDIITAHYLKNRSRLVKKYSRWAGSPENAEDVVQTAYMRALQYSDSYNDALPFDQWFIRIINNSLKTMKRQERGGRSEFNEEDLEGTPDVHFDRQLWRQITDEIKRMPNEEHKEVLSLYFIHGYTPRAIVKVIDFNYKNVETIINRFKVFVKEKYGDKPN